MAAARCQQCNINYPHGHPDCDVCGKKLPQNFAAFVHKDWEQRVARARKEIEASETADQTDGHSWRIKKLTSLGISEAISEVLADSPGFDWHEAEYLIRVKGCPPELAERILV